MCMCVFFPHPENGLRDCSVEFIIAHTWIPVQALPLGDKDPVGHLSPFSASRLLFWQRGRGVVVLPVGLS